MTRKLFCTDSFYSQGLAKKHSTTIFVFGDNQARTAYGGQAIIRDAPNARGIATVRGDFRPMMGTIADFEAVIRDIRNLEAIMDTGQAVLFPILNDRNTSLGTGIANLPKHAPELYGMINNWFLSLGRMPRVTLVENGR